MKHMMMDNDEWMYKLRVCRMRPFIDPIEI